MVPRRLFSLLCLFATKHGRPTKQHSQHNAQQTEISSTRVLCDNYDFTARRNDKKKRSRGLVIVSQESHVAVISFSVPKEEEEKEKKRTKRKKESSQTSSHTTQVTNNKHTDNSDTEQNKQPQNTTRQKTEKHKKTNKHNQSFAALGFLVLLFAGSAIIKFLLVLNSSRADSDREQKQSACFWHNSRLQNQQITATRALHSFK